MTQHAETDALERFTQLWRNCSPDWPVNTWVNYITLHAGSTMGNLLSGKRDREVENRLAEIAAVCLELRRRLMEDEL